MNWTAKLIKHRNESRIAVYFDKKADFIERIKLIEGTRWSQQKTVWHIPDTIENRVRLKIEPLANSQPSEEGIVQIEKFKQWLRSMRYSESTISTYSEALKSFLIFYREKPVIEINNEDVIIYGLRCGELFALQPVHIDSLRNIILLKNSKGKKDRIVPLSTKIFAA